MTSWSCVPRAWVQRGTEQEREGLEVSGRIFGNVLGNSAFKSVVYSGGRSQISIPMRSSYLGNIGTWIQRKIYLYNVTFGLYMLEWWERYIFNTIIIVFLCVVCYNGSRFTVERMKRLIWHVSAGAWEDHSVLPAKGYHHFPSD
ncbi:hypothetical protein SUGI_0069870 [Cryptomeria japonica]|nr:hypothetical protein SUGI_0069870 [Cryptomeria japonica]